jgi:hypothetical protein
MRSFVMYPLWIFVVLMRLGLINQIKTVIVTTYTKKGEKVKNINYMCILSTCIALSDSLVHVVVTRLVPAVNVSITAGVVLP